jgi:hypothetical protein
MVISINLAPFLGWLYSKVSNPQKEWNRGCTVATKGGIFAQPVVEPNEKWKIES